MRAIEIHKLIQRPIYTLMDMEQSEIDLLMEHLRHIRSSPIVSDTGL